MAFVTKKEMESVLNIHNLASEVLVKIENTGKEDHPNQGQAQSHHAAQHAREPRQSDPRPHATSTPSCAGSTVCLRCL